MNEIIKQDFHEVVKQIHLSQQKAYKQVNATLIELYWEIGKYISAKCIKENWGKGIVQELADFIKLQDPKIKGFTARSIWRMKQFYETYKDNEKLSTLLTQISWSNNLLIMSASKTEEEREFYIMTSIKEKYSYRELERQIDSGLFQRTMIANEKLSSVVRELPQDTKNVFRDSYALEFLGLPKEHSEKDLQQGLVSSLKDFILEIGKEFCFMGQEYKVQVGNTDFSIDLLFYHRNLQCMVVFELKIDEFKPSYLGQLEFYLEALDRDVKKEHENPSIGILLCRKKNEEIVEYALSRSLSPTVISEYETQLIPKKVLQDKLDELYLQLESTIDE
jgi:predicted nuclease of restriction endonuclease-like (RecB) superfamily